MDKKLLTISIAAYNVQNYITETLTPFLDEKYNDMLEVFVIDDGGKDSTAQIAKGFAERFPQIINVVHKENGGWGSTVNTGIGLASGKYFKLLDGDDFFDTEELDRLLKNLQKIDADLILTPYYRFDEVSKEKTKIYPFDTDVKYLQNYSAEEACRHITDIAMHGCVFRTEVLKQNDVTITEKCFYTDVEYICKGLAFCKTVCFADNAVYMYRVSVSGQSVSVEGVKKHYKDYLKVVRALIDFYRKTPMEESVAEVLHKRICESIAAY